MLRRPTRPALELGDVHRDIPFVQVRATKDAARPRGQRRRVDTAESFGTSGPIREVGLLCHYTCGFVAQPPGTEGYSHSWRLMAPVMHFRTLLERGWDKILLNRIMENGREHGVLYLPWPLQERSEDQWSGHGAALLYRPTLVTQDVLDVCPRLKRLSQQAQLLLSLGMIQVVSPNTFDPRDRNLQQPDVSDSWAVGRPGSDPQQQASRT